MSRASLAAAQGSAAQQLSQQTQQRMDAAREAAARTEEAHRAVEAAKK